MATERPPEGDSLLGRDCSWLSSLHPPSQTLFRASLTQCSLPLVTFLCGAHSPASNMLQSWKGKEEGSGRLAERGMPVLRPTRKGYPLTRKSKSTFLMRRGWLWLVIIDRDSAHAQRQSSLFSYSRDGSMFQKLSSRGGGTWFILPSSELGGYTRSPDEAPFPR